MKIAITLSVDSEIKQKAMQLIQGRGGSVSFEVNNFLKSLIEKEGKQNG